MHDQHHERHGDRAPHFHAGKDERRPVAVAAETEGAVTESE